MPTSQVWKQRRRLLLWAVLEVVLIFILASGVDSGYTAYCWKCAVFLKRSTYFSLPLPFTETEAGDGTQLIRASYPDPCDHEWIQVVENRHACGNIDVSGHWKDVGFLERRGLLDSAKRVDALGAANLARWILRYGVPEAEWAPFLQERGLSLDGDPESRLKPFSTREEFRDWSSRLRASIARASGLAGY